MTSGFYDGVAYEVTGSGPAVVLLHPWMLDSRVWAPQVAALARDCAVITIDQRGLGLSPPTVAEFDPVQDIEGVLGCLGISEALVVGIDTGAEFALKLALSDPPPRVWDSCSSTPCPRGSGWNAFRGGATPSAEGRELASESTELLELMSEVLDAQQAQDAGRWARAMIEVETFLPATHPQVPLVQRMLEDNAHTAMAWNASCARAGLAARLPDWTGPTVLVSNDEPGAITGLELIGTEIPHADSILLPTSATLVNLDLPARFTEIVRGAVAGANRHNRRGFSCEALASVLLIAKAATRPPLPLRSAVASERKRAGSRTRGNVATAAGPVHAPTG